MKRRSRWSRFLTCSWSHVKSRGAILSLGWILWSPASLALSKSEPHSVFRPNSDADIYRTNLQTTTSNTRKWRRQLVQYSMAVPNPSCGSSSLTILMQSVEIRPQCITTIVTSILARSGYATTIRRKPAIRDSRPHKAICRDSGNPGRRR